MKVANPFFRESFIMSAQQMAAIAAHVRTLTSAFGQLRAQHNMMLAELAQLRQRPRSITEEIDALPGRRVEFVFTDELTFTAADEGQRAQPLTFTISQDGPFIMTHYPLFLWRPSAPSTATNLGIWRPVSSFPLPDQVVDTDIIDIMYEIVDGGSQRNLQDGPRSLVMSRPDNFVPLPVPTMYSTNSTIQVIPTFNAITFNGTTPPTDGILHCDLIGYRVVNM